MLGPILKPLLFRNLEKSVGCGNYSSPIQPMLHTTVEDKYTSHPFGVLLTLLLPLIWTSK